MREKLNKLISIAIENSNLDDKDFSNYLELAKD